METISERVRALRKKLGLNQTDFAKKIGLSDSALSRIEIGGNSLIERNIISLCASGRFGEGLTVNKEWLLNGGDPSLMFEAAPRPDEMAIYDQNQRKLSMEACEMLWIYQQLSSQNKAVAKKQINVLLECQGADYPELEVYASEARERPEVPYLQEAKSPPFNGKRPIHLRVWGRSAAGNPREVGQFNMHDETRPCDPDLVRGDPDDYGWIAVEGTSMSEAGINDGDWAVVKRATIAENGEIMLVRHGDDVTLKRIKIEKGSDGGEEVWMCWEDGSGRRVRLDDEDYGIQAKFVAVG